MDPINYNIDVKSPFEQSMGGFNSALGMRTDLAKVKQAEQAQALQAQLQTDLGTLAKKPNASASDFSQMMIKYPQLSEHFKRGWDTLNAEQQQNKLSTATQVYAAVNSGNLDVAKDLLTQQATALRNSGKEDEAKAAETMAKFIEMDPNSAKTTTGLLLSSLMGPDKFAETFTKLQTEGRETAMAPAKLQAAQAEARQKKADADLAEIKAKYGEQNALVDYQKKGWDIKNIESEILSRKEQNRIAAITAATGQGHLKLDTDKFKLEAQQKVLARISDVTTARTSMDNMLNTADRILKHPGLEGATGSVAARLPSFRQDSADFDALIDNLNAQEFTSQIPNMKGMGALSDAEGKKLAAALQNLDLKQSPDQLRFNVKEAQRLILKARQNLVTKYGIPDTTPDTPAAAPDQKTLQGLLDKYGPKK